jgi:hypothetical protein
MNSLEQSFANICEKHGLHAISVQFSRREEVGEWFTVYLHRSPLECVSGTAGTIAPAIGSALAKLPPITLADEPLPEEAAAAEVRRRAGIAFDEQSFAEAAE